MWDTQCEERIEVSIPDWGLTYLGRRKKEMDMPALVRRELELTERGLESCAAHMRGRRKLGNS